MKAFSCFLNGGGGGGCIELSIYVAGVIYRTLLGFRVLRAPDLDDTLRFVR